jgi:hypothetical protein
MIHLPSRLTMPCAASAGAGMCVEEGAEDWKVSFHFNSTHLLTRQAGKHAKTGNTGSAVVAVGPSSEADPHLSLFSSNSRRFPRDLRLLSLLQLLRSPDPQHKSCLSLRVPSPNTARCREDPIPGRASKYVCAALAFVYR